MHVRDENSHYYKGEHEFIQGRIHTYKDLFKKTSKSIKFMKTWLSW